MVVFGDVSACANCGRSNSSLQRCGRCRLQAYCGAQCQRSHYKHHKSACREAAAAAAHDHHGHDHSHSSGCMNADRNPVRMAEFDSDVPPHVVPRVGATTSDSGKPEYSLCYHDTRPGRPWMVQSSDPDTGRAEHGTISEATLRLVPMDVKDVPKISPPRNMVKGSDITDDEGPGGLSKEENVACLLNGFNIRHYVHKFKQESCNGYVVTIEFDARMTEFPESSKEATLCLTVTLRSDGMGDPSMFPDCRRRIHLHADFTNIDTREKKSIVAGWVGSTTADSPWATVRGLLPLGIDFVLNHPYYSSRIARARERGKKVEIRLYDCSPVFGLRGEANTSDMQLTRMMYFLQAAMKKYGAMELCRLPDGYTGEEVDANPEAVVKIMRKLEEEGKWVGQPLLVTEEERCVPRVELREEAFRVEFDDLEMEWV